MKKLIKKGNKVLALCLTVMIVITSCVFFAPTSFAADAADEKSVSEVTYTCTNCGAVNSENQPGFSWLENSYKHPTHTANGSRKAICSSCGKVFSAILPAVPEHQWDYLNLVKPTCEKEGSADIFCIICNYYELNAVLEKLPHTVVNVDAVAATCTEDGKTAGSYCSACGEVLEGLEVIPALGHQEVVDKGYAATCTEDGLTDGSHCSVCGEALVAQEVIPAKGHTDENKNGYCDECHKLYCDCFHHKIFTNKFYKVIFKIVVIFWKFMGINQTCACGQKHYSSIF